jgi:hypothetical protein
MECDRRAQALSAFARAVEAEWRAIDTHETAARRLDQFADDLERRALREWDEHRQGRARGAGVTARERAQAARGRAAAARQRLREEGFDAAPGSPEE